MREICFVGKGENLKKISFRLGINSEIPLQKDLVYNNRYIDISRRKKYPKHLLPYGHPRDGNRVLMEW